MKTQWYTIQNTAKALISGRKRERHSAQHWQLTVETFNQEVAIILLIQSRGSTPTTRHDIFSRKAWKNTYYCILALLTLKVTICLLPSTIMKPQFVTICNALFVETPKTWLSYSEISNYCNEILSERVK